ncbi:MAG: type II toxin-antitoxin system RelE/ParE family toxin [Flavobacteriales bacterium]
MTRLLDRVQLLATYPTMGRITPEVSNPVIRELREGKYRIVYRHRYELVEVLLVYHSARQQLPLRRLL